MGTAGRRVGEQVQTEIIEPLKAREEPGRRTIPVPRVTISPHWIAAVIIVVGAILRLYRFNALSLWTDEGLSVYFSRLPWATVLGLHGAFAPHPPGYFILTKLVSLILPETIAGRMVSVVAGTLTLVALYALASRLIDPRAGIIAVLVLALSPVHVWYSQEARPYATVTLLVCMSYLSLVSFYQSGQRRWLAMYGTSLVLAMYTEYSAFFSLLPQVAVLLAAARRQPQRVRTLAITALLASLLFVPWLPQLLSFAGPASDQPQFAVSGDKVLDTFLSLIGLSANGVYWWGSSVNPWNVWPELRPVFLLSIGATVAGGGFVFARRSTLGLSMAFGLLLGPILTSIAISRIYQSFTVRTVLSTVLSWALLVGAVPFLARGNRLFRSIAFPAASLTCVLALISTIVMYQGADKQHWNLLAADSAVAAHTGLPMVMYPDVTETMISLYAPRALRVPHVAIRDGRSIPAQLRFRTSSAVWVAYTAAPGINRPLGQLAHWGYQQVMHNYYWNPLYLDLFVRKDKNPGQIVSVNGNFIGSRVGALGWQLPGGSYFGQAAGGRVLVLKRFNQKLDSARTTAPAAPDAVYTLEVQERSRLHTGSAQAFLICETRRGGILSVSQAGSASSPPNDGRWHRLREAVLCPAGTQTVTTDLRNVGGGIVSFRSVEVRLLDPPAP